MSQGIIVYGLRDPRTNEIRYIGRSSSWKTRPDAHRRAARKATDNSLKSQWIRELIAAGFDYEMVVMEICDDMESVIEAERKWIAEGRRLEWPLFNRTHAPTGATFVSAETKARISAAKMGKPRPDLRGRPNPGVSKALRLRERGEDWRKKMEIVWQNNRGKPSPPRGIRLSDETKAKMSEARRLWHAQRRATATSSACQPSAAIPPSDSE